MTNPDRVVVYDVPVCGDAIELALPSVPLLSGPKLIGRLRSFLRNYVVLPAGLDLVLALWALGTHLFEAFDCYPSLFITSPTKGCGKTLVAELIGFISARSKSTVNISEAALFRLIEAFRPMLIIDESETLRNQKSERSQFLLSLLNAGHRRNGTVTRCEGPTHELVEFSVFCPKIAIAIGLVPETLRDRSIPVSMRKRRKDEKIAQYRFREVSPQGERLQRMSAAWVKAHEADIASRYAAESVDFLADREADNWAPLFSIAAVAVPELREQLKQAALRLGKAKRALDANDSAAIRLLTDIRRIFTESKLMKIRTKQLLSRLRALEESPWGHLTDSKLATILRPFDVSPRQLWIKERNLHGYDYADLKPVFDSYVSS